MPSNLQSSSLVEPNTKPGPPETLQVRTPTLTPAACAGAGDARAAMARPAAVARPSAEFELTTECIAATSPVSVRPCRRCLEQWKPKTAIVRTHGRKG